jgi:hypothetical protein
MGLFPSGNVTALRCLLLLVLMAPLGLLACGSQNEDSTRTQPQSSLPISGTYEVKGLTKSVGSIEERRISGTVIVKQQGDRYTASFELDTTFPGAVEPLQADVIGNGDGIVDGRTLMGSARMQMVVSTVPGVDTGFAFVPRVVGARIASTSAAVIAADGSIVIEIENHPAEGDKYRPTRTRLTGTRLIDVAAPPPE